MDLLSTLVFFFLEFINMYENLYILLCNTLKFNFFISISFWKFEINKTIISEITVNNGYLGSYNDEERSEM